jgi:hypothetical protein
MKKKLKHARLKLSKETLRTLSAEAPAAHGGATGWYGCTGPYSLGGCYVSDGCSYNYCADTEGNCPVSC